MMRFSELWRISSTVYREICFQSIFSLRLGATFPRMGEAKIEKLETHETRHAKPKSENLRNKS